MWVVTGLDLRFGKSAASTTRHMHPAHPPTVACQQTTDSCQQIHPEPMQHVHPHTLYTAHTTHNPHTHTHTHPSTPSTHHQPPAPAAHRGQLTRLLRLRFPEEIQLARRRGQLARPCSRLRPGSAAIHPTSQRCRSLPAVLLCNSIRELH